MGNFYAHQNALQVQKGWETPAESHHFNKSNIKQEPFNFMIWVSREVKLKKSTWILLNYFPPWFYTNKQNGKIPYSTESFWLSISTAKVRANHQHKRSGYATSGNQRLVFSSLSWDSSNPAEMSCPQNIEPSTALSSLQTSLKHAIMKPMKSGFRVLSWWGS